MSTRETANEGAREPGATTARTGRSGRRRGLVLLLGVVVVFTLWHGNRRVPAIPTRAPVLEGTVRDAPPSAPTFRVGTFNIHGGKGTDRRVDLARTAGLLKDLDLVALHEVDGALGGLRASQAAVLGEMLGMAWLFAPTERRWWRDHFGNALLTRVPLETVHQIALPGTQRKKFRNVVLASFRHEGELVRVLATHLDRRTDRAAQLRVVCDLFLALREPVILMGDLNTPPGDPQLAALLATPGVVDVTAAMSEAPPGERIDWILVRGLRPVSAGYVRNDASDHPLVRAELTLVDQP